MGALEETSIKLIVENTNETEIIHLLDITLLWSVKFFNYSDIARIGPEKGNLSPGMLSLS